MMVVPKANSTCSRVPENVMDIRLGATSSMENPWLRSQAETVFTWSWLGPNRIPNCSGVSQWW